MRRSRDPSSSTTGSTDGSPEHLLRQHPDVRLVARGEVGPPEGERGRARHPAGSSALPPASDAWAAPDKLRTVDGASGLGAGNWGVRARRSIAPKGGSPPTGSTRPASSTRSAGLPFPAVATELDHRRYTTARRRCSPPCQGRDVYRAALFTKNDQAEGSTKTSSPCEDVDRLSFRALPQLRPASPYSTGRVPYRVPPGDLRLDGGMTPFSPLPLRQELVVPVREGHLPPLVSATSRGSSAAHKRASWRAPSASGCSAHAKATAAGGRQSAGDVSAAGGSTRRSGAIPRSSACWCELPQASAAVGD